jgi:hypothetical protein
MELITLVLHDLTNVHSKKSLNGSNLSRLLSECYTHLAFFYTFLAGRRIMLNLGGKFAFQGFVWVRDPFFLEGGRIIRASPEKSGEPL